MIRSIDAALCIGCGNCVKNCPLDTLRMGDDGKAFVAYPDDCHSCYLCEMACPAGAIFVSPYKKPFPSPFDNAEKGGCHHV